MGKNRRIHGPGAAGAGHLGSVPDGEPIGNCPSCGVVLRAAKIRDPRSGNLERAILHPMPFCTYFGKTDASVIERDIAAARGSK